MFKEYDLKDNLHLQELALKKKKKKYRIILESRKKKNPINLKSGNEDVSDTCVKKGLCYSMEIEIHSFGFTSRFFLFFIQMKGSF